MTLYLVHGNTCFECYGYEENVYGIFTSLVQAQAAKIVAENNLKEMIEKNPGIYFSSEDVLDFTIRGLNHYRKLYLETKDKKYWWQMIQLLPSSYNQTRNVMLNYEVLANIYHSRKNHKLDEWRDFCKWIEEKVPYSWLITEIDKEEIKIIADNRVYLKY